MPSQKLQKREWSRLLNIGRREAMEEREYPSFWLIRRPQLYRQDHCDRDFTEIAVSSMRCKGYLIAYRNICASRFRAPALLL
jgi:hypothetical protein